MGNPSPCIMLYQEMVASVGRVPAARAPPASEQWDRVRGAGSRKDLMRHGYKIKAQVPQQEQR